MTVPSRPSLCLLIDLFSWCLRGVYGVDMRFLEGP